MSKKVKYAVIQLNAGFKKPRIDSLHGSFREAMSCAKRDDRQTNIEHYVLSREDGFEAADLCKTIRLEEGDKLYLSEDHNDPCFRVCGHFESIRDEFESELRAERGRDNLGDFELVCYQ